MAYETFVGRGAASRSRSSEDVVCRTDSSEKTVSVLMDDRAFFAAKPRRRYRARDFVPEELGWPTNLALFSADERGETGEINLVIVKRIKGGRVRKFFAAVADAPLDTDKHIKAFLRSRGVTRFQHDWRVKRP